MSFIWQKKWEIFVSSWNSSFSILQNFYSREHVINLICEDNVNLFHLVTFTMHSFRNLDRPKYKTIDMYLNTIWYKQQTLKNYLIIQTIKHGWDVIIKIKMKCKPNNQTVLLNPEVITFSNGSWELKYLYLVPKYGVMFKHHLLQHFFILPWASIHQLWYVTFMEILTWFLILKVSIPTTCCILLNILHGTISWKVIFILHFCCHSCKF